MLTLSRHYRLTTAIAEFSLAFALACSSFKGQRVQEEYLGPQILPFPMEFLRANAIPLALMALCVVALISLMQRPKIGRLYLLMGGAMFVSKCLVIYKESWFAVSSIGPIAEVCTSILTIFFVPLIFLSKKNSKEAFDTLVRVTMLAGGIFAMASIYLAVRAPEAAFWMGRMLGASAHPLFVAIIFSACTYVASIRMLYCKTIRGRFGYLFLTALFAGLMMATGSRSPLVALAIAYMISCIRNIKLVFWLMASTVFIGLLTYLAYIEIPSIKFLVSTRLVSTDDTRSVAWSSLWGLFLKYPLFGAPFINTYSENSVLKYLARVGIIGIPSLFMFVSIWIYLFINSCRILVMSRDSYRAGLAMICVGLFAFWGTFAIFEGYIWESLSFSYLLFYLAAVVGVFLHDDEARFRNATKF